jgi:membrane protein
MGSRSGAGEPGAILTWREFLRVWRRPLRFLGEFGGRLQEDDVLTTAGALAYYFFFSLFPLVLFVLALASVLPIRGLDAWLLENARQSLPEEGYAVVEGTVRELLRRPRGGLVSLGAVLALWTASTAFAALMNGLNRAHRVVDPRPWWLARLYAIGLTVVLSLLMILAFVLTVFGAPLVALVTQAFGPAAGTTALVIRWILTLGAVVLVTAAIYYACPATERRWRWVRPGSVVFTLGFVLTSGAFSYYVSNFGEYDRTYGSLGAVIILLFWMYIMAFFLLVGGELNAYLEERVRGAEAQPAADRPGGGEPPDARVRA